MRRLHKDWLASYLEFTQYSEAPDSFHLWAGIATIAGALRRKVFIDMGYFTWYPNFFLTFVAPPGIVSKSTTAGIGISLLRQVEGIKIGPSSATWQSIIPIIAAAEETYTADGRPITAQSELLPMSALTIAPSEYGTFLDPENKQSLAVLCDLWDCPRVWDKATKMDGLESLTNVWLQIIGCTTPSWIAENLNESFVGGGLASRILFVYADAKRKLVANPRRHMTQDRNEMASSLVSDLTRIASLSGEYKLAPDAEEWAEGWYERHFHVDNPLRTNTKFEGYFARKQTHIYKTAMVRAASLRDDLVIMASDIQWAEKQVTTLEGSMLKVFGEINREEIVKVQGMIARYVQEVGKITKQDLYRHFSTQIGYETFEACLNGIFGAGVAELTTTNQGTFITVTERLRALMAAAGRSVPGA